MPHRFPVASLILSSLLALSGLLALTCGLFQPHQPAMHGHAHGGDSQAMASGHAHGSGAIYAVHRHHHSAHTHLHSHGAKAGGPDLTGDELCSYAPDPATGGGSVGGELTSAAASDDRPARLLTARARVGVPDHATPHSWTVPPPIPPPRSV